MLLKQNILENLNFWIGDTQSQTGELFKNMP